MSRGLIYRFLGLIFILLPIFMFVIPRLVSADSDLQVSLGIGLTIASVVVIIEMLVAIAKWIDKNNK